MYKWPNINGAIGRNNNNNYQIELNGSFHWLMTQNESHRMLEQKYDKQVSNANLREQQIGQCLVHSLTQYFAIYIGNVPLPKQTIDD